MGLFDYQLIKLKHCLLNALNQLASTVVLNSKKTRFVAPNDLYVKEVVLIAIFISHCIIELSIN